MQVAHEAKVSHLSGEVRLSAKTHYTSVRHICAYQHRARERIEVRHICAYQHRARERIEMQREQPGGMTFRKSHKNIVLPSSKRRESV
jgi:hypothetical protein